MRQTTLGLAAILAAAAGHAASPAARQAAPAPQAVLPAAPPPRLALPQPGRPSPAGAALRDLGYVEVPFSRVAASDASSVLILEAHVNDRALRLLIDTGAAHTCVDREWAKFAGLRVDVSGAKTAGLGSSDVQTGRTETVELTLGRESASAVLGVMDLSHLNTGLTRSGLPAIDGLLGDSTLHHFAAVVDYPGSRLYLLPPRLQVPTDLAGNWRGVKEERNGKPVDPPSAWWVEFANGQVRLTQDAATIAFRPVFGAAGAKTVILECVINRKPVTYPATYALEDGRLKLCIRLDAGGGFGPPKEFATKAGDGCVLVEFERDPPDPPPDP